jgi:hypothetical protein
MDEGRRRVHSKASEEYIHVQFRYENENTTWEGWVPVEYRRTGVSIQDNEELIEYLNSVYEQLNPNKLESWLSAQEAFWTEKRRAIVTKPFFDSLAKGGWQCVKCTLPANLNWARRIQDLKEFGYTLATDTNRYCPNCNANNTHILLLPLERGGVAGNGYETWSPALRKRILKILETFDVYEFVKNPHSLPDHKFSEIRWDSSTKGENPDDMSDEEIRQKFQLLSNQRNQQKREICRTCFQTGKRGTIFGIPFYYVGGEIWDENIPKTGKEAEKGCLGCAWYDIAEWRKQLIKRLNEVSDK